MAVFKEAPPSREKILEDALVRILMHIRADGSNVMNVSRVAIEALNRGRGTPIRIPPASDILTIPADSFNADLTF